MRILKFTQIGSRVEDDMASLQKVLTLLILPKLILDDKNYQQNTDYALLNYFQLSLQFLAEF
jgi:hypothetical protein